MEEKVEKTEEEKGIDDDTGEKSRLKRRQRRRQRRP
jgi:hypothetical protein